MSTYRRKYNPKRQADWNYGGAKWKLSRSKIDYFIECPRCFWLDNVWGIKRPGFPSFNLNIAVDELFKKEFDIYREQGETHPLLAQHGVTARPFTHDHLETWRNPFEGVVCTHEPTGLRVSGGIDDVWVQEDGETLVIADYKATSKETSITQLSDSPWDQQYKRQLGIYRWIFEQNGFSVDAIAYLIYANADQSLPEFGDTLQFETTLIPVETEVSWIDPLLHDIKECLDDPDTIPASNEYCEFCPYREACGKKLLAVHRASK